MKLRRKDIAEIKRRCPGLTIENRPIGKPKIERKPAKEIKVHAMIGRNIYIKNGQMKIENGWVYPWNWRNHE